MRPIIVPLDGSALSSTALFPAAQLIGAAPCPLLVARATAAGAAGSG